MPDAFNGKIFIILGGLVLLALLIWIIVQASNTRTVHHATSPSSSSKSSSSSSSKSKVAAKVDAQVKKAATSKVKETKIPTDESPAEEFATKLHPCSTYLAPCFDHGPKTGELQVKSRCGGKRQYIVLYKERDVESGHVSSRNSLFNVEHGIEPQYEFKHLNRGFSASLSPEQLKTVQSDLSVQEIHADVIVRMQPMRPSRQPSAKTREAINRLGAFAARPSRNPPKKAPPKPPPRPPPPRPPAPPPRPPPPPPKKQPPPAPPAPPPPAPVNGLYPQPGAIYGWNMTRVGINESTVKQTSPDGVDVYVVDTGVDSGNKELNAVETKSFVTEEKNPVDLNGHGTFCAGIIGSRGLTGKMVGILPNVRIHGLKVLNASGSGSFSSIIAALNYIYAVKLANPSGKLVVSMSLGATVGTSAYNILDTTIVRLIQANVPVVIAAGNDGIDASLDTPAHVKEALTVGAFDRLDKFGSFSNRGPVVDILGPGVDIKSTWLNNGSYIGSGTSFSCPHATGLIARYLSSHPMPSTVAQLWNLILASGNSSGAITNVPANTTARSVYTF